MIHTAEHLFLHCKYQLIIGTTYLIKQAQVILHLVVILVSNALSRCMLLQRLSHMLLSHVLLPATMILFGLLSSSH